MVKASAPADAAPPPEWDPGQKEPWYEVFEAEPVNDDKWSCVVTTAIPVEAADEECVQTYTQCVNSGLRKNLKIISMSDIIKSLRGTSSIHSIQKSKQDKGKTQKNDKAKTAKPEKAETTGFGFKLPTPRYPQVLNLAATWATITDTECKLSPDLMAAVIKYIIFVLKDENCLQKRVQEVRRRKLKERNIKAKFIRSLKPFEITQEESVSFSKVPSNILGLEEPIEDAPFNGPDLYVMLTDVYDLDVFTELVRINVPFLAIIKTSFMKENTPGRSSQNQVPSRVDTNNRKAPVLSALWETLSEKCDSEEETKKFKDFLMLPYEAHSWKNAESKENLLRLLFDELTWVQYFAYNIHRQYQSYRRELLVQPIVISLQQLDLSSCEVYNKTCDALITGQPLTPALVLFAMIEQVAAGVPDTENIIFDDFTLSNFDLSEIKLVTSLNGSLKHPPKKSIEYTTPCYVCRDKIRENICAKLKKPSLVGAPPKKESTQISEEISTATSQSEENMAEGNEPSAKTFAPNESPMSESHGKIWEKKSEKQNKKWKAPILCFHGDKLLPDVYHCDPQILDSETLFRRFFQGSSISRIWRKYPEKSPQDKAFLNFHLDVIQKISQETEESGKLKINFAITMKLIAMIKTYVHRGDEENVSMAVFSLGKDESSKNSKTELEKKETHKQEKNRFFTVFLSWGDFVRSKAVEKDSPKAKSQYRIPGVSKNSPQGAHIATETPEDLRKADANFNMSIMSEHSSGLSFLTGSHKSGFSSSDSGFSSGILSTLFYALDHPDFASMLEPCFLNDKDEYLRLIQGFTFYEKLEPKIMIQKLLEAEKNYNTMHYSYFKPTDSVVLVMVNDVDYRGMFHSYGSGVLPTPVSLRDFFFYVYREIKKWLTAKENNYASFLLCLQERIKSEEDEKDRLYLRELRREYCEMNPIEREDFLEGITDDTSEPEVTEDELQDIPIKPKYLPPRQNTFIVTNLTNIRVEINSNINEFHSEDGTEVSVSTDSWLYDTAKLLTLMVKHPKLHLYYYRWLESEDTNAFTLKSDSDIIFSFYKADSEKEEEEEKEEKDFNYYVNISWPTGLLIQPLRSISGWYIKQSYLKICKAGWDIEEEKSRCFLRNGQVIIFKESGDYDILCGNGTKYIFYETETVRRYEIITTTGEIWEVRTQGPCKDKKKLRATYKVLVGNDPKTQEVYYRREDGVSCMLWPNARLVTNFSDGTKITSTPFFDGEETTDWTDEEKLHFTQIKSKHKLERELSELRSKTILRNSSAPKISESISFTNEPFVCVSCSYLMEHPKYATVFFNLEEPYTTLLMPHKTKVFVYPEGTYEIRDERSVFKVQDTSAELSKTCNACGAKSAATLFLDNNKVLCKFIDFFQKTFLVLQNGETAYYKTAQEIDQDEMSVDIAESGPLRPNQTCLESHGQNISRKQRCFVLERDLSGVEFVHSESIAIDCNDLPEDSYFDLHSGGDQNISHTISSPYYKVGYETWEMEYEDKDDSLPTNLKKSDLKELGVRENPRNPFRYPFPKHHNCSDQTLSNRTEKPVQMPKIIVARIFKCLSSDPYSLITTLNTCIEAYQEKARDICNKMEDLEYREGPTHDSRYVQMRLKKIALTLNQSFNMYPHLCTQFPSTEKDIHYSGHFINLMESFKNHMEHDKNFLPDCKQIPRPLPRVRSFPTIKEENEL